MAQMMQQGARVTVTNTTGQIFSLRKTVNWSGKPENADVPQSIMPGRSAEFSHFPSPVVGSKGAVVYTATRSGTELAWVLAWEAPNDAAGTSPNKVYVYCDATNIVDGLTDNQLLQRLNLQGASSSEYPNPTRKMKAIATISYSDALNMAEIQATFGLTA